MSTPVLGQPPRGLPIPTNQELRAIGQMGAAASRTQRVALMNEIGSQLGIPPCGWQHGQSRLLDRGDIRLVWLLRRLASGPAADRVERNLRPLASLAGADVMLTIVTAAREASSAALTEVSMRTIETWHDGGIDFLGLEIPALGLPRSIVGAWHPFRTRLVSTETKRQVFPAEIPARDQVVAYGAQIRYSFQHAFQKNLARVAGPEAASAVAACSRAALLVWKALSFLAPGGQEYQPRKSVAAQSGQTFGSKTALEYLARVFSSKGSARFDLGAILTERELNDVESVRSAKIRAAEALFLDHHLFLVRQIASLATLWR